MWRFIHQLTGKLVSVDPAKGGPTPAEAVEARRSAKKYRAATAPVGVGLGMVGVGFFGAGRRGK